jgi:hypothetical protein
MPEYRYEMSVFCEPSEIREKALAAQATLRDWEDAVQATRRQNFFINFFTLKQVGAGRGAMPAGVGIGIRYGLLSGWFRHGERLHQDCHRIIRGFLCSARHDHHHHRRLHFARASWSAADRSWAVCCLVQVYGLMQSLKKLQQDASADEAIDAVRHTATDPPYVFCIPHQAIRLADLAVNPTREKGDCFTAPRPAWNG